MNKQNRNTRVFGWTAMAALLVFLAAGPLRAIGPDERGERRQATRESQIRAMDAFALSYGDADWSLVAIAAHPGDAANPKTMSVFLSLGNVSLTRFEEFRAAADLDHALGYFEAVAGSEGLWGRRPFAGEVVAYLGISLARLTAECGGSPYESRIEELRQKVIEISAAEADAVAPAEVDAEQFRVTTPEEDAARAALYTAAAVLRPDSPGAKDWGQYAAFLAVRLSSLEARSAETSVLLSQAALLYEMTGNGTPSEIRQFFSAAPLVVAFRSRPPTAGGSGVVISLPEPLETAIAESRFVAALLADYLRQFPPGSECVPESGNPHPVVEFFSPAS